MVHYLLEYTEHSHVVGLQRVVGSDVNIGLVRKRFYLFIENAVMIVYAIFF